MMLIWLQDTLLSPQHANSSTVAPRRRLRSADASTIIQRGTGTQGTPATSTTNQIASRRRSPTGRSTALVALRRRLTPTSRMIPFGCPCRRYSKDYAKRSSEVAAASTTLASSGGRGRGRVATEATTGRAQGMPRQPQVAVEEENRQPPMHQPSLANVAAKSVPAPGHDKKRNTII
ncbi:hypothetical protein L3Y34_011484 [Caenorhabditis briggsae]|uniref:Uncharacterized protein n=1 Tax=Caenorhabditis briggsae TaxID=6238 RepID=A0AAE8ZRE6_CAEBR|nr:hypothetical protein L3Y34_011484 [Caenorhabditis briggsae]